MESEGIIGTMVQYFRESFLMIKEQVRVKLFSLMAKKLIALNINFNDFFNKFFLNLIKYLINENKYITF